MVLAFGLVFAAAAEESVDVTGAVSEIKFPETFSLGKWYDAKWDATWEFLSDNIKLYKGNELLKSFKGDVKNFKTKVTTTGVVITFDCDATSRSYSFTKGISLSTDLEYKVDRHDTNETHSATIKRK